jgi:hypothetical protein
MIDQSMRHCVFFLERIEAEEIDHSGQVIDARRAVSFLPIHDAHLVATDHFGEIDLPNSKIEPALSRAPASQSLRSCWLFTGPAER